MFTNFPGFQKESTGSNDRARTQPKEVYKPREWSLAAKVVYPCGVEYAAKTFESYKAPGPDGIYSILLKKGLVTLLGPLTKVLRASIALRHVL